MCLIFQFKTSVNVMCVCCSAYSFNWKIAVVANKLHLVLNVPIKAVDGFQAFVLIIYKYWINNRIFLVDSWEFLERFWKIHGYITELESWLTNRVTFWYIYIRDSCSVNHRSSVNEICFNQRRFAVKAPQVGNPVCMANWKGRLRYNLVTW